MPLKRSLRRLSLQNLNKLRMLSSPDKSGGAAGKVKYERSKTVDLDSKRLGPMMDDSLVPKEPQFTDTACQTDLTPTKEVDSLELAEQLLVSSAQKAENIVECQALLQDGIRKYRDMKVPIQRVPKEVDSGSCSDGGSVESCSGSSETLGVKKKKPVFVQCPRHRHRSSSEEATSNPLPILPKTFREYSLDHNTQSLDRKTLSMDHKCQILDQSLVHQAHNSPRLDQSSKQLKRTKKLSMQEPMERYTQIPRTESASTTPDTKDFCSCQDNALYEFMLGTCAIMALENAELKKKLEDQKAVVSFSPELPSKKKFAALKQRRRSLPSAKCLDNELRANSEEDEDTSFLKKMSDMRLRIGWVRRGKSDSVSSVRPHPEEAQTWAHSFQNLMDSKYGQSLFKAFLQREFSEENIEFYLAVQDFRQITRQNKMVTKAASIHSTYVATQSPKEINLDPATRNDILSNLENPDKSIFDVAQKRVQALMESDAYLRFLQSELYRELLTPPNSNESSAGGL